MSRGFAGSCSCSSVPGRSSGRIGGSGIGGSFGCSNRRSGGFGSDNFFGCFWLLVAGGQCQRSRQHGD